MSHKMMSPDEIFRARGVISEMIERMDREVPHVVKGIQDHNRLIELREKAPEVSIKLNLNPQGMLFDRSSIVRTGRVPNILSFLKTLKKATHTRPVTVQTGWGDVASIELVSPFSMPDECDRLRGQELPFGTCPFCGFELHPGEDSDPHTPLVRGMSQRVRRPWWNLWKPRPYCAIICPNCHHVAGWEEPKEFAPPETSSPYRN